MYSPRPSVHKPMEDFPVSTRYSQNVIRAAEDSMATPLSRVASPTGPSRAPLFPLCAKPLSATAPSSVNIRQSAGIGALQSTPRKHCAEMLLTSDHSKLQHSPRSYEGCNTMHAQRNDCSRCDTPNSERRSSFRASSSASRRPRVDAVTRSGSIPTVMSTSAAPLPRFSICGRESALPVLVRRGHRTVHKQNQEETCTEKPPRLSEQHGVYTYLRDVLKQLIAGGSLTSSVSMMDQELSLQLFDDALSYSLQLTDAVKQARLAAFGDTSHEKSSVIAALSDEADNGCTMMQSKVKCDSNDDEVQSQAAMPAASDTHDENVESETHFTDANTTVGTNGRARSASTVEGGHTLTDQPTSNDGEALAAETVRQHAASLLTHLTVQQLREYGRSMSDILESGKKVSMSGPKAGVVDRLLKAVPPPYHITHVPRFLAAKPPASVEKSKASHNRLPMRKRSMKPTNVNITQINAENEESVAVDAMAADACSASSEASSPAAWDYPATPAPPARINRRKRIACEDSKRARSESNEEEHPNEECTRLTDGDKEEAASDEDDLVSYLMASVEEDGKTEPADNATPGDQQSNVLQPNTSNNDNDDRDDTDDSVSCAPQVDAEPFVSTQKMRVMLDSDDE